MSKSQSIYLKEIIGIHKGHMNMDQAKPINYSLNDNHEVINLSETGASPNDDVLDNLDDIDSQSEGSSQASEDEIEASETDLIIVTKSDKKRNKFKKQRSNSISLSSTSISLADQGKMITDENTEDSVQGWQVFKRYLGYLGGWKFILLTQFSMCGFTTFKILSDYSVGNWASSPDQASHFLYFSLMTLLFATTNSFFTFMRVGVIQMFSWFASRRLHKEMLHSVLNAPINLYFDVTPIGRILNRFSKDLSIVELQFSWPLGGFLLTVYQAVAILVVATIVVKWTLALLPVILFLVVRLYKRGVKSLRETVRIESITKSPLLSYMGETYTGVSTIRAFKREEDFVRENNRMLNSNILANRWQSSVQTWFSLRIDLISISLLSFTTIFCIFYRDSSNQVFLALMFTYILQLQDFILWSVKLYAVIEQRMVNIDRCLKLIEVPQEDLSGKEEQKDFFIHRDQWPEKGRIVFDRVNLKYRPTTEVILKDLTFEVKSGEKIGVVGRTGAGKSTICISLSRIVEIASGSIMIDGASIADLPLNEVRRRITVIPQDPTMFTGTLRFNLDPEGLVDDERIVELLKDAKLEDLLNKDPKGILQDITENGQNLSSGEKQLICICRAILRKSQIVILDEATANIDVVTEQSIQRLIQTEFQNSTMITIAHRLNTIIASDRVLVLSFGQIMEYDSPTNLMNDPNSEFSILLQELKKEEESSHGSTLK